MSYFTREVIQLAFQTEAQILRIAPNSELLSATVRGDNVFNRVIALEFSFMHHPDKANFKAAIVEPILVRLISRRNLMRIRKDFESSDFKYIASFAHDDETYYIIDAGEVYCGPPSGPEKDLMQIILNEKKLFAKRWWLSDARGEWIRVPLPFTGGYAYERTSREITTNILGPDGTKINTRMPLITRGGLHVVLRSYKRNWRVKSDQELKERSREKILNYSVAVIRNSCPFYAAKIEAAKALHLCPIISDDCKELRKMSLYVDEGLL